MGDLQDIVRSLQAKGASLAILDQNIDTGSAAGKAFLNMLGTFAEFENDLRRERQIEGIRKAQLAGRYKAGSSRARRSVGKCREVLRSVAKYFIPAAQQSVGKCREVLRSVAKYSSQRRSS
jgi:DNA invertase Pin-like site-specific DNA recombinase